MNQRRFVVSHYKPISYFPAWSWVGVLHGRDGEFNLGKKALAPPVNMITTDHRSIFRFRPHFGFTCVDTRLPIARSPHFGSIVTVFLPAPPGCKYHPYPAPSVSLNRTVTI